MAKFITVICKVKGETILNLNDLSDIASNSNANSVNNVNYKTINVFSNCDKDIIIDRKAEPNNSNSNSIETQPRDEVKDEMESMDEELEKALEMKNELDDNRINNVTIDGCEQMSGNSQLNKSNDSIKSIEKYCETIKRDGQMWHYCRYYQCQYSTIWSNAIICHIRSHTGEKPYVCQYPNCGKAFSISCNLRNHAKGVHANKSIARVNTVNRSYVRSGRKKKRRNKKSRAVIANKYVINDTNNTNNAMNCDNKQNESLVDDKSSAISNCLPDKVSYKTQLMHQMPARKSYFMHTAVKSVSNFGIKQTPKPVDSNINVTSITNDMNNKQNEKQTNALISSLDANKDKPILDDETIRKEDTSLDEKLLEVLDENNHSINFDSSFESIRVVSSYLKTTKKNGKLWRVCRFPNCAYGSNLVSSLIHHVRTHTGERPFKCPFSNCDKSFTIKTNLNNHIKVHKGVDRASRL